MICSECKKSNYEVEVIKEGNNILNTDRTKHVHSFQLSEWNWYHYDDSKIDIAVKNENTKAKDQAISAARAARRDNKKNDSC